jgi:hypothetical protein
MQREKNKAQEFIILYNYYTLLSVIYIETGCESWSLTLREECRLRVFENKVLSPPPVPILSQINPVYVSIPLLKDSF